METESINDTESINNILKKKDKTYSIFKHKINLSLYR